MTPTARTEERVKVGENKRMAYQLGYKEATTKHESAIAHAIGFCRGLGHPETYLENKYPHLVEEK